MYAPWCGHCKKMAGEWAKLGDAYAGVDGLDVAQIDCTADANKSFCTESGTKGFPTVVLFKGDAVQAKHKGPRTATAFAEWLQGQGAPAPAGAEAAKGAEEL